MIRYGVVVVQEMLLGLEDGEECAWKRIQVLTRLVTYKAMATCGVLFCRLNRPLAIGMREGSQLTHTA